jgi:hypothetical protein
MIPLSNDQLREQFRKIYGRTPESMFELDQFRRNRPSTFFEPRRFKKKRNFRKKSGIALPAPELSTELLQGNPAGQELVLDLAEEKPETADEHPADVNPAEEDHEEEKEGEPESDQGMIDGKL